MIGDAAQYQELLALYGSYSDDELIGIGRGMADLTEMAQESSRGVGAAWAEDCACEGTGRGASFD